MVLSYSSTEFIRFNAIMAFLSMSRYILLLRLGWHLAPIPSFLSHFIFSNIFLARRLALLNTNTDCMLLWGNISRHDF